VAGVAARAPVNGSVPRRRTPREGIGQGPAESAGPQKPNIPRFVICVTAPSRPGSRGSKYYGVLQG